MENASNALIMAGSVLIGIIIISIFVYLISVMGDTAKQFEEDLQYSSIQKFNEVFEAYAGKEDLTVYDLLTVYNLIESRTQDSDFKVDLVLPSDVERYISNKEYFNILIEENEDKAYECEEITYSELGYVNSIKFVENRN